MEKFKKGSPKAYKEWVQKEVKKCRESFTYFCKYYISNPNKYKLCLKCPLRFKCKEL